MHEVRSMHHGKHHCRDASIIARDHHKLGKGHTVECVQLMRAANNANY